MCANLLMYNVFYSCILSCTDHTPTSSDHPTDKCTYSPFTQTEQNTPAAQGK